MSLNLYLIRPKKSNSIFPDGRWPFVTRKERTHECIDTADEMQNGIPKLGEEFKLLVRPESEGWSAFNGIHAGLAGLNKYDRADAFHNLGQVLMKETEREPENYKEAIEVFKQDYLLSSKLKSKTHLIPALRHLAICYEQTGDYPAAIRHCEQALNVALRVKDVTECQGAFTELGSLTLHWYDEIPPPMSEYRVTNLEDRKILRKNGHQYFTRALEIADQLPIKGKMTQPEKQRLKRQARLNLANSFTANIGLSAVKNQQSHRGEELRRELEESPNLYTSLNSLTRYDHFAMDSSRIFYSLPPPNTAEEIVQTAEKFVSEAENMCPKMNEVVIPPSMFKKDDIDFIESGSYICAQDVRDYSDLRHSRGQLYEAVGRYEQALPEYIASVRRVNLLRDECDDSFKLFIEVFEGQMKSLKSACLLAIRRHRWEEAKKFASQRLELTDRVPEHVERERERILRISNKKKRMDRKRMDRTRFVEEKAEDLPNHEKEAEALIELVRDSEQLVDQVKSIDERICQINENATGSWNEFEIRFELYSKKTKLLRNMFKENNPDHDRQLDEWFTRDLQSYSNAQREMLKIIRQQRELLVKQESDDGNGGASAGAGVAIQHPLSPAMRRSFQRESMVWIHLSQSVSELCSLHAGRSPDPSSELKLCNKYWSITRQWFDMLGSSPNLGFEPMPEWIAMTQREHSYAIINMNLPQLTCEIPIPTQLREIQIKTYDTLERCKGRPVYDWMIEVRREQAGNILASLEEEVASAATPPSAPAPAPSTSSNKTPSFISKPSVASLVQLKSHWESIVSSLEIASDACSSSMLSPKDVEQVYEGEKTWEQVCGGMMTTTQRTPTKTTTTTTAATTTATQHAPSTTAQPTKTVTPTTTSHTKVASAKKMTPTRVTAATNLDSSNLTQISLRAMFARNSNTPPDARRKHPTSKVVAIPIPFGLCSATPTPTPVRTPSAPVVTSTSTVSAAPAVPLANHGDSDSHRRKRRRICIDGTESPDECEANEDDDVIMITTEQAHSQSIIATAAATDSTSIHARKRSHVGGDAHAASTVPPTTLVGVTSVTSSLPPAQSNKFAVQQHVTAPTIPAATTELTVDGESVDELIVALCKLNGDDGRITTLRLKNNFFTPLAVDELIRLFDRSGSLRHAVPLSALRVLDLSFSNMSDPADWGRLLLSIRRLPRLTEIDLTGTMVGGWCMGHLRKAIECTSQLRTLKLDDCAYLNVSPSKAPELVSALTSHRCIEHISLEGAPLTPLTLTLLLRACIHLPQLHTLSLSYVRVMSYQYLYQHGDGSSSDTGCVFESSSTLINVGGPSMTKSLMRQQWYARRTLEVAIGKKEAEEIKRICEAMVELMTTQASHHTKQTNIHLKLSVLGAAIRENRNESNSFQRLKIQTNLKKSTNQEMKQAIQHAIERNTGTGVEVEIQPPTDEHLRAM